jgi:hypothetical protein
VQQRLRPLSEAECYARCYAAKSDNVRVVRLPPRPQRYELPVSGEELRLQLEARLDARDPESLVEPEAA